MESLWMRCHHTHSDVNEKHVCKVGQFQTSQNETGSQRVRLVTDRPVGTDVVLQQPGAESQKSVSTV